MGDTERPAQAGIPLTREVGDPSAVSARPAQEPWSDRWGLSGLLKQVQKAIREAPPEVWDDEARDAGDTVSASLSNRLRELEVLDMLAVSVPCAHPRCELPVIARRYGRTLTPEEAEEGDWFHILADGKLRPLVPEDGERHAAASRKEGQGR